jgi:small GTP-binding protein
LGDAGVGKTSICRRLESNEFSDLWESTVGCGQFDVNAFANGETVRFTIIDTAGQERYHGSTTFVYRACPVAFLIFSLDDDESAQAISQWKDKLDTVTQDSLIYVIGNKCDLEMGVSEEAMISYCHERGFPYVKVSAKTGEGLGDLLDDVAQKVLQAQDSQTEQRDEQLDINPNDVPGSGCQC